jgi:hypothetical protein
MIIKKPFSSFQQPTGKNNHNNDFQENGIFTNQTIGNASSMKDH